MFPEYLHAGWLLSAAGAVLTAIGAVWGARRLRTARSLIPVAVVRVTEERGAEVAGTDPHRPAEGVLEEAGPCLFPGDELSVRPSRRAPGRYAAAPRPAEALWAGFLAYGVLLLALGAHALAQAPDSPAASPLRMVGAVFSALPFLAAGKLAGVLALILRGTRVRGRVAAFRRHPHVRFNDSPASQAQVEYEYAGAVRRAWSPASYASSLGAGRPVTAWVDDRSPVSVLTLGTGLFVFLVIGLVPAPLGLAFLLGPIWLG
ncbi:hypothetical protein J0910_21790 [Nocardiopsis sp. CNT-189]|uniref:hypothetical protein n=1 Tax=Nocardiopsis oceanisediminis TaxID=2816862 RepID=UPI003B342D8B